MRVASGSSSALPIHGNQPMVEPHLSYVFSMRGTLPVSTHQRSGTRASSPRPPPARWCSLPGSLSRGRWAVGWGRGWPSPGPADACGTRVTQGHRQGFSVPRPTNPLVSQRLLNTLCRDPSPWGWGRRSLRPSNGSSEWLHSPERYRPQEERKRDAKPLTTPPGIYHQLRGRG